ncbi:MAG: hypothetical protein U0165_18020 [Polyangiaceae bacterium]
MAALDVARLIPELSATVVKVRAYAEKRRAEPTAASMLDPFAKHPWVSRRDTLDALRERDDPGARWLSSWVCSLLFARVLQDAEINELAARETPSLEVELPRPERISFRTATKRLVSTRERVVREQLARAVGQHAPRLAAESRELWARRGDISQRLGLPLEGTIALLDQDDSLSAIETLAKLVLRETHELWQSSIRGAGADWHDVLVLGSGLEGDVGWPRLISTSLLREWFGGEAGWLQIPPSIGSLPALLNGASFTRLLARFGVRWADVNTSRSTPAALASQPYSPARWIIGAAVAGLLTNRVFLSRAVGFSKGEIERTIRAQSMIELVALRLSAARCLVRRALLLGDARLAQRVATDAMCEALQRDVPSELATVMPRLSLVDPTRLIAWGPAMSLSLELRDSFDEDWFRNPRSVHELRDRFSKPSETTMANEEVLSGLRARFVSLHERLS